MKMRNLTYVRG